MREIVARMQSEGLGLQEALAMDPRCQGVTLPEPSQAIGLSAALVDECLRRLGYSS